jgi:asparagine synthase (glutamine-hydrolysing)
MCGIVGGLGVEVNPSEIESAVALLYHRGPDNQGFRSLSETCHMGVARLAMTDPHPRSNQPLSTLNGRFTISFNGEIYNFKDIRKELIEKGISFNTESDTEVLVNLIATKGLSGLEELQGMFAFAFYDELKNNLIIARDRLGKKPLYYSSQQKKFYWSSSLEILANLTNEKYTRNDFHLDYLSLGYQLDPNTGYDNIYALMPGHYIEIENGKSFVGPKSFKTQITNQKYRDSMRSALWNAIQVRTEGHKDIAISLSGGVDSTLIALGLKKLGVQSTAFSAFWSNSDKDRYNSDKEHAKDIARILGHEFVAVDISKSFKLEDTLRSYLIAMEEPNNNPSGLSTLALYKTIAENGIKLLLTGDGSDEIFGGYSRHINVAKLPQLLNLTGHKKQRLLFSRDNRPQRYIANLVASQLDPQDPLRWLHWHWVFTPKELQTLLNPSIGQQEISSEISDLVEALSPKVSVSKATQSLMRRDHEIWLSMESNRKLDRISMAFSIEARSPFQDDNVIEIANRIMNESDFSILDKGLLKAQFPELETLPVKKEKVGFTSPIGHWMRQEPQFIRDSISYLKSQKEWDGQALNFFSEAQYRSDYRTNMQLWTLVVYSNWLKLKNGL